MAKGEKYSDDGMLRVMKLNEAISGVIPECLENTYKKVISTLDNEIFSDSGATIGKIDRVISQEGYFPSYSFKMEATNDPVKIVANDILVPVEIEISIKPVALIEWEAQMLMDEYDELLEEYGYSWDSKIVSENEEVDPSTTSRELNTKLEDLVYSCDKQDEKRYSEYFRVMAEIKAGISKLKLELQQATKDQEEEEYEEWEQ